MHAGAVSEKRPPASARHDRRAERRLASLATAVLVLIVAMVVKVFIKAWPSFSHNGLAWFGPGGDVDEQIRAMAQQSPIGGPSIYWFRACSLIWGTLVTTVLAVIIA